MIQSLCIPSAVILLLAQAPGGPVMELARVELVGAKRFTSADVVKLAGLKIGASVTITDLNAAAQRLADSGLFENVKYRYVLAGRRATVTYEIEESPWTIPVTFDNFVWFTDAEVAAAVREVLPTFDGKVPKSHEIPDRISAALQKLVDARKLPGQVQLMPEATVTGLLVRYLFAVKDPAPKLCQLTFNGAAAVSEADLANAVRPLIGTDYSRATIEAAARGTVTDIYRRRGFWRAAVAAPSTSLVIDGACNGVAVALPVTEGQAYTWGGAEWSGNTVIPSSDLDAALAMKSGDISDMSKIDEGIRNVRALYGRKGHLQQRTTYTPRLDDAGKTAVFALRVEEGPQYRMGSFEVVGLTEADAAEARKLWKLQPGDVYDDGYSREFTKETMSLRQRVARGGKPPTLRTRIDPASRLVHVTFGIH